MKNLSINIEFSPADSLYQLSKIEKTEAGFKGYFDPKKGLTEKVKNDTLLEILHKMNKAGDFDTAMDEGENILINGVIIYDPEMHEIK